MSVSTRDAQDAPCCLRRWERLGAGEVAVVGSVPGEVPWESRPGGGVLGDPPEEPPGTSQGAANYVVTTLRLGIRRSSQRISRPK